MRNILKYLLLLFLLGSCKNKKKEFSINQESMPISRLKELAIDKGDTDAYHELSIAYMDSPNDSSFINTATAMADKHHFPEAYLDVYYSATDYYHRKDFKDLDDLSNEERLLALDYLKKGAEKGNKECMKLLGYYYIDGKYFQQDTIKGNKLVREGEKY